MDKGAAILTAIIVIGCTAIGAVIAYAIATSDLPPWFKFWLLK